MFILNSAKITLNSHFKTKFKLQVMLKLLASELIPSSITIIAKKYFAYFIILVAFIVKTKVKFK